jgi:hypothetical protein
MFTEAGLLEGFEALGLGALSALGLRTSLFDFFCDLAMMPSFAAIRLFRTRPSCRTMLVFS